MRKNTRNHLLVSLIVTLLMLQVSVVATCADVGTPIPTYDHAQVVFLDLSFASSKAECFGYVTPKSDHSVNLSITLYLKSGDTWKYLTSWSNSGAGPSTVFISGSTAVGSGTYKAVLSVNIGSIEYISKSVIRTK